MRLTSNIVRQSAVRYTKVLTILLLLAPACAPAQEEAPSVTYADMILVEGNPLSDVSVLVDYDENIKIVMKDGELFKNTL